MTNQTIRPLLSLIRRGRIVWMGTGEKRFFLFPFDSETGLKQDIRQNSTNLEFAMVLAL